jgi:RNA polymerase sigma factor (sigma-70 family)
MYMMRNKKEVVMRKYNNLGVDLGGLSMTDPVRYRKINAVLNDKGKKKDLLDRVETVPLEYVYDLANDSPSPEDNAILSELKVDTTAALGTLKPREEWVLRKRFGIGLPTDYTLNEIGKGFSVTTERIRQIEAKALRKLKHPSRKNKLKSSLTF